MPEEAARRIAADEDAKGSDAPDVRIQAIRSAIIPDVWPSIEPLVRAAVDEGPGDETLADIVRDLAATQKQLWLVLVDNVVTAAVITTIAVFPQRKICRILYLGGKAPDTWYPELHDALVEWAKQLGCSAIESWGRRGWAKLARKVKATQSAVVYRKAI